jgi:hypothetical protein
VSQSELSLSETINKARSSETISKARLSETINEARLSETKNVGGPSSSPVVRAGTLVRPPGWFEQDAGKLIEAGEVDTVREQRQLNQGAPERDQLLSQRHLHLPAG